MNQNTMKKLITSVFLLCFASLFTTMGDSEAANGKKVNFYGKLETYTVTVQTKRVEQIIFWNRQLKAQLFEAPVSVIDMINAEQLNTKKANGEVEEVILAENQATQGIVATVELHEIQSLSTPPQKKIIYKKNDSIIQEFISRP